MRIPHAPGPGLAGVLLCGLLLLGCSDDPEPDQAEAAAPAEPAEPDDDAAADEADVADEADEEPEPEPVAPLTGLPGDEADWQRPAIAAKIDNAPAARPQSGIDRADAVFVELVEGATRMIGVWHSQEPGRIGPVRSGRMVDADILPGLDPVFVLSGAARQVWPVLQEADLPMYHEGRTGGAFSRDSSRSAPHNLYVDTDTLWELEDGDGPEPVWAFDEKAPDGGEPVERAGLVYPRAGSYAWEWTGEAWARSQGGSPHVSAGGEQLEAATVAIARVALTGAERRPFEPLGEGEGWVLRDGVAIEATWRKESAGDQYEWVDADGEPIPFAPGPVWVELLPTAGSLELGADE